MKDFPGERRRTRKMKSDTIGAPQENQETVPPMQQELQKQQKLRQKDREIATLQKTIEEMGTRLSKMASERMREGNPTVEDLNDPRRPTALVSRWTSLFRCGEYWTAYEKIKSREGEATATSKLHKVCQMTYESTEAYVEGLKQSLRESALSKSFSERQHAESLESFLPKAEERNDFLAALKSSLPQDAPDGSAELGKRLDKLISQSLKSRDPPAQLHQSIQRALSNSGASPELIEGFIHQLTEIIYYMRVQEIKVVVDFDCQPGHRYNADLYEVEGANGGANSRSSIVKAVIRPALLRHEAGPVLSKGEVELQDSTLQMSPAEETAGLQQNPDDSDTRSEVLGLQEVEDSTAATRETSSFPGSNGALGSSDASAGRAAREGDTKTHSDLGEPEESNAARTTKPRQEGAHDEDSPLVAGDRPAEALEMSAELQLSDSTNASTSPGEGDALPREESRIDGASVSGHEADVEQQGGIPVHSSSGEPEEAPESASGAKHPQPPEAISQAGEDLSLGPGQSADREAESEAEYAAVTSDDE